MNVKFIQFLMPDGRQKDIFIDLPDELEPQLKAITECGCRLTAEILMNDLCSFCIEEPELGDYAQELCANGPQVPVKIIEMIRTFDAAKFKQWKANAELAE